MGKLQFHCNERPTIGVEVELALVNAHTMALSSSSRELLAELSEGADEYFKAELMQCVIEVITGVCDTVAEAEWDLRRKLVQVERAADKLGLRLFWAGSHPFSAWREQQITPTPRYEGLVNLLQEMARRLVTFGLHVHVGVDSGDKAVMICDRILQHLPTLLAMTSSSPFWEGRLTGLQSYRSKIMEVLPTAGLPPLMRNWSEYVWLVNHMVDTGFINTIREIWWDVRPHHNFGTVEVRICDMPGNIDDVAAVAALIQCLIVALSEEIDEGIYQHDCHPVMVQQNKWRACRYGHQAQLVDEHTRHVRSLGEIAAAMLDRLRPVAQRLACSTELERVLHIATRPSWSVRQQEILAETGSPAAVVRRLSAASRISPSPVTD